MTLRCRLIPSIIHSDSILWHSLFLYFSRYVIIIIFNFRFQIVVMFVRANQIWIYIIINIVVNWCGKYIVGTVCIIIWCNILRYTASRHNKTNLYVIGTILITNCISKCNLQNHPEIECFVSGFINIYTCVTRLCNMLNIKMRV